MRSPLFPNPSDGSRGKFQIQPTQPTISPHESPDGSRGKFQIQPTKRTISLPRIPPTAVGGSFRSSLLSPRSPSHEFPRRQSGEVSDPAYSAHDLPPTNSPDGSRGKFQIQPT